ncbi:MAG: hypothetical protein Q9184_000300 [Pyrenodesmia sp. 2 TL-2023]
MLFRREFTFTVSGSRGSGGFYSHLINTSPGHGAGKQHATGQPEERKLSRRKHTSNPARSIVFQSPAAIATRRNASHSQASAGRSTAAEDPQHSTRPVYDATKPKGQSSSITKTNVEVLREDHGRTPLRQVRLGTEHPIVTWKGPTGQAREERDPELESGLQITQPSESSRIEKPLDTLPSDIHVENERDRSDEHSFNQIEGETADLELPSSRSTSAPRPVRSSQCRTADVSDAPQDEDSRHMPPLKSGGVGSNMQPATKAAQQASRVISDTALLSFPDTIDSGASSNGELGPNRGPSFKSSPAPSAQQLLFAGDFFAGRPPLAGNMQHSKRSMGSISGSLDTRVRRVQPETPISRIFSAPRKVRQIESLSESPATGLIGGDSTRIQLRKVFSSPDMAKITSIADEHADRLRLGSTPDTQRDSAKSRTLLFEGPNEQENHKRSKRAQQSLDDLLDALCDAANETVHHSRRTTLQLCKLDLRTSGDLLCNAAYSARVFTCWREDWHSPEDRHGYPYVSQRLRVLRLVCEKHKREAELACKSSWRPVFYELVSLEKYRTLHGLRSEKKKNKLYHKLVAPLTRSLGEIQAATEFGVSRGKGRISETVREVISTRTAINHHMRQLFEGWILLASGRWYRRFELVGDSLRQSTHCFRSSVAELGESLEWLYRREWGLYRSPRQKEWREIKKTVDSYARLHKPIVPQLQPNGSSVYIPAQGDRGEVPSSIKRQRQTSWAKLPFFQSGIPTKDSQDPVSVTAPRIASFHTSSAASFEADAFAKHLRPRLPLSLKPPRTRMGEHAPRQCPDYFRMRTLSFSVLKSLEELIEMLRTPIGQYADQEYKKPLLLYALEFRHTKASLEQDSYHARKHVRLREEWDSTTHGSNAGNESLRSKVLNRLREGEEKLASISFSSSLRSVYGGYLEMQQFRHLYGLCSLAEQMRLHRRLVEPVSRTGNELRSLIFRGFKPRDKAVYPFRQFEESYAPMVRIMEALIEGWLQPWAHYKGTSMIVKDEMIMHIKRFRQSCLELQLLLSPLRHELKKASQTSNGSVHVSPPGRYMLDPEWEKPCQTPASLNSSPKYLPEEGKERERKKDRLKQTPWPKTSPLRSSTPLRDSPSVVGTLDQKVASFHTSATARHPAASPAPNVESEAWQEEEPAKVNRGNETLEAPICSPRGYRIPPAKQRECMLASIATRPAYWQYTLYEGPQGERVKVHYCRSLDNTERISKLFLNEKVIGFDIEWKPLASAKDGIRKNVAMIQLASEERIALFHLARFSKGEKIEDLLAPTLKQIMESDAITKVGVSIKSDCTRLRTYMNVDSRGLFELSHLYKLVKYADKDVKKINKKLVSLATQTEEHLNLPMYKDQSVRSSDWSAQLNYEQIYYAASDSYAGFQLYHILNHKRQSMFPTPPLPAHANLNLPIRLANGQTVAEYEEPDAEEPPPEPSDDALSPVGQLVEGVLNLQIEDRPPPSATSPAKPKQKAASLSPHPSIVAANEWIARYLASSTPSVISSNDLSYPFLPPISSSFSPSPSPLFSSSHGSTSAPSTPTPTSKPRPTPAPLRAYFLFHHHRLSIPDIASLLRDPPLQHATIAGYVLDTVRFQNLTLRKAGAEQCLEFVGEAGKGRYKALVKRLEELDMI